MFFLIRVAWRNLWRQGRRSLITSSAMATAVAMCMATVCLSDGMYAQMGDVLVTQSLGHVQIHHPDFPSRQQPHLSITGSDDLLERIDQLEGVTGATGRLFGSALIGGEEKTTGIRMIGVEPPRETSIVPLQDKMVEGRWLSDEPAMEIVLGAKLAEELEVSLGEAVVVITQATDGSLANELYEVVGIVRTGRGAIDRGGGYLHLADMQALLAMHDEIHEVLVIGEDPDLAGELKGPVEALADEGLMVRTWSEADPITAQTMGMQDVAIFIFVGVIFAVASLGVLNTMLMAVFERTRELGLLKALGLTPFKITAMIVWEAIFLSLMASVLGGALGGLLDWYLVTTGLDFSVNGEGFEQMGVAFDPIIKGQVKPKSIAIVLVMVFAISVLAALWPAARGALLRPVDAMRKD